MYKMAKNNFTMEISEIKERLTMSNVLHYYGLKTDKQSRINCPFHFGLPTNFGTKFFKRFNLISCLNYQYKASHIHQS